MLDPSPGDGRPLGRAAFFATIAAGVAGIALAPRLTGAVSSAAGVLPDAIAGLAPAGGWRIYSVTPPMPDFDPASYRLRVSGLVERAARPAWWQVAALPRHAPGERLPLRDRLVGRRRALGGDRAAHDAARARAAAADGDATCAFVSLEEPYVDQLELGQFLLPDVLVARGMDGGAAAARARRAAARS